MPKRCTHVSGGGSVAPSLPQEKSLTAWRTTKMS